MNTLSTQHWKRTRTLQEVINGLEVTLANLGVDFAELQSEVNDGTLEWTGPLGEGPDARKKLSLFVGQLTFDALRFLENDGLRVITVEPEQVAALPDLGVIYAKSEETPESLSAAEMATIALGVPLPFDPLYLDFGADAQTGFPLTQRGSRRLTLLGAFLSRDEARSDGALAILPVVADDKDGRARIILVHCGILVEPEIPTRVRVGYIHVNPEGHQSGHTGKQVDEVGWVAVLAAERILAVLGLLCSANVGLEQSQLRGKAAKIAARKGQALPWLIKVRSSTAGQTAPKQQTTALSHRFDVRGHFKHYTQGAIYDANPTRRMIVPGRGECVRVWTPPYVKGPADKPYVPRVRLWLRPPAPDE